MYVPAAEVVTAPDGLQQYQGQPVTSRAGKMGKSLKNAISPDDIYAAYGADTLRLYEMAMGLLDADRPWRTDDIIGVHRFLQRSTGSCSDCGAPSSTRTPARCKCTTSHPTTRPPARCTARSRPCAGTCSTCGFNTAIARLMELNTHAVELAAAEGGPPRGLAEPLVLMVAPFAPDIAEELWSRMGHAGRWPKSHSPSSTRRWRPSRWSRCQFRSMGRPASG
jgi:leucyl-tRNA synthetase